MNGMTLTGKVLYDLRDSVSDIAYKINSHPTIIELLNEKNKDGTNKHPELCEIFDTINSVLSKQKNSEFVLGVAGGQSSGKSALLNSLFNFPILSMANTATTATGVKVKFSERPYIKIYEFNNNCQGLFEGKSINLPLKISNELFELLKVYACGCATSYSIVLENLRYFHPDFDEKPQINKLHLDLQNAKHIAMLFLALVSTYVKQDKNPKNLTKGEVDILNLRRQLFKKIGLNPDTDYMIELGWNAEILKKGLVFFDLPGLGSIAEGSNTMSSHNQLAKLSIAEADAMIFVVGEEGPIGDSKAILDELIKNIKFRHTLEASERLSVVINKIDKASPTAVLAVISNTNVILSQAGFKDPSVLKYCALGAAEYLYVTGDNNIPCSYTREYSNTKERFDEMGCEFTETAVLNAMKNKFENKTYYKELVKYFDDYALQSLLISIYEIIFNIFKLENRVNEALRQSITIQSASLDFLGTTSKNITTYIEEVSGGLYKSFRDSIDCILGEEFDNIITWSEKEIIKISSELHSTITAELQSDKDNLIKKINDIEQNWFRNIIGNIILVTNSGSTTHDGEVVEKAFDYFHSTVLVSSNGKLLTKTNEYLENFKAITLQTDKKLVNFFNAIENTFVDAWGIKKQSILQENSLRKSNEQGYLPESYLKFLDTLSNEVRRILAKFKDVENIMATIKLTPEKESDIRGKILSAIIRTQEDTRNEMMDAFTSNKRNSYIMDNLVVTKGELLSTVRSFDVTYYSDRAVKHIETLFKAQITFFLRKLIKNKTEEVFKIQISMGQNIKNMNDTANRTIGRSEGEVIKEMTTSMNKVSALNEDPSGLYNVVHKTLSDRSSELYETKENWVIEYAKEIEQKNNSSKKEIDSLINGLLEKTEERIQRI